MSSDRPVAADGVEELQRALAAERERATLLEAALHAVTGHAAVPLPDPPQAFQYAYQDAETGATDRFVSVSLGDDSGVVLDALAMKGRPAAQVWAEEQRHLP
jgi:hypothetical protein